MKKLLLLTLVLTILISCVGCGKTETVNNDSTGTIESTTTTTTESTTETTTESTTIETTTVTSDTKETTTKKNTTVSTTQPLNNNATSTTKVYASTGKYDNPWAFDMLYSDIIQNPYNRTLKTEAEIIKRNDLTHNDLYFYVKSGICDYGDGCNGIMFFEDLNGRTSTVSFIDYDTPCKYKARYYRMINGHLELTISYDWKKEFFKTESTDSYDYHGAHTYRDYYYIDRLGNETYETVFACYICNDFNCICSDKIDPNTLEVVTGLDYKKCPKYTKEKDCDFFCKYCGFDLTATTPHHQAPSIFSPINTCEICGTEFSKTCHICK